MTTTHKTDRDRLDDVTLIVGELEDIESSLEDAKVWADVLHAFAEYRVHGYVATPDPVNVAAALGLPTPEQKLNGIIPIPTSDMTEKRARKALADRLGEICGASISAVDRVLDMPSAGGGS